MKPGDQSQGLRLGPGSSGPGTSNQGSVGRCGGVPLTRRVHAPSGGRACALQSRRPSTGPGRGGPVPPGRGLFEPPRQWCRGPFGPTQAARWYHDSDPDLSVGPRGPLSHIAWAGGKRCGTHPRDRMGTEHASPQRHEGTPRPSPRRLEVGARAGCVGAPGTIQEPDLPCVDVREESQVSRRRPRDRTAGRLLAGPPGQEPTGRTGNERLGPVRGRGALCTGSRDRAPAGSFTAELMGRPHGPGGPSGALGRRVRSPTHPPRRAQGCDPGSIHIGPFGSGTCST